MALTVDNLYGLLQRSRLVSPEEAQPLLQRWHQESPGTADNPERFQRWLVANHYVTEYQAGLLARGHAEGFFLGPYKILERLGKGRMGGVYKAVHSLGQIVAMKVLPPSKAKDARLLRRFQREARLALRLKHPNVVRAFQVGETNGLHYIVMEYLEGETLDDVLHRRRQLPAGEAVRVVYQALLGLQHIYEQGMVHRDLKPANLMLVPAPVSGQPDTTLQATVKILDIGLGRMLFDESSPSPDEPQITAEGVLVGTPDYMSPEQARNARAVDIRADIYSLGCVLYHALAGHPPFPDKNIIQQIMRHASEPPRSLKEINAGVPDGLQQIMDWMLAKEAGKRYPVPDRAAQALSLFLAAEGDPAPPADAEPHLRSYLTWLEMNVADEAAAREARGNSSRRKKRKRKTLIALPAPPAEAKPDLPVADIDVELLPAATMNGPGGFRWSGLHRRDFLMMGIGAGAGVLAVLGAIGVGWLVARIRPRE